MKIVIPLKPISVNKIFQGRRFKTKEYKDWRQAFGEYLQFDYQGLEMIKGWIEIDLKFYIYTYRLCDVDNMIKGTQDALVDNGAIEDDRFIKKLTAEKFKVDNKEDIRIEIKIKSIA